MAVSEGELLYKIDYIFSPFEYFYLLYTRSRGLCMTLSIEKRQTKTVRDLNEKTRQKRNIENTKKAGDFCL